MVRPGPGALLHDVPEDLAVAPAPGVLPVSRLVGVIRQIEITELVHLPVLHPAKAGEVGFGEVVGGAIVGPVFQLMIHPAGVVFGMKGIVGVGFIGADRGTLGNEPARQIHHIGLILVFQHEGQRLVGAGTFARQFLTLLPHHEYAALGGLLVLRQAPVDPLRFLVLGADMAVHVGPVHVDLPGQGLNVPMLHQRFPNLVCQDEGSLVLDAQVTAQLKGRNALHRIGVQGDCRQIHLQRQLVEREDCSAGHRESVVAGLAAPLFAGALEVVALHHAAHRAGHFLASAPANLLEYLKGFRLGHFHHLPNRQGASFGGEEEVLFVHYYNHLRYFVISNDITYPSIVNINISRMMK